jgi:4-hydroxy-2-oxoheptanedioate aldolase
MIDFKKRLQRGTVQLGLWQALANSYTAEICARTGFDWLLFDMEHAPNTMQTMLTQIQAVTPFDVAPIARIASAEPVAIKQLLDMGFSTILVPMIEDADQAGAMVRACRYPPVGIRGVSSATARAAEFGGIPDYLLQADSLITLIAQIESVAGLENVASIVQTPGLDAIFIGPNDLAACMGYPGNSDHPEVQEAIDRIKAAADESGKPIGIFGQNEEDTKKRIAQGYNFVSVGTDIGLLLSGSARLLSTFRS